MTISELYERFDDVSEYTQINVYDSSMTVGFVDCGVVFRGIFSDMGIELTQANVVRFSNDYSQDALFVII